MIARSSELAAVLAARRRGAPGVVMSAPPGMGRTTVADAAAEALRAEGVDVVVVRATATSRAVPMAALAPLVVDLPPGGDVDGAIEHALLARDGLTLVVDDAHLLDDASATLLAGLLDGFAGRRSFLFATAVEPAEPSPLLDHPALSHVQLRPLDEAGVSTILRAAGVSDEDVETWHQRSAGNPAALVRMIGGHEPGLLELSVDSSEVRRLLESVAVAESLSMDAATALLGNDHVDAVRQALDTGLIVTDSTMHGHVLRFRSPADADEVLSVLPPLRRRALVRATVDAVRDDGGSTLGRSPRLVDLARHAGLDVDVEELRQASRAARHGDDGALALRLAEAAAASGDPDDVRHWVDVASERATDEQLDDALTALRDAARRPPTVAGTTSRRRSESPTRSATCGDATIHGPRWRTWTSMRHGSSPPERRSFRCSDATTKPSRWRRRSSTTLMRSRAPGPRSRWPTSPASAAGRRPRSPCSIASTSRSARTTWSASTYRACCGCWRSWSPPGGTRPSRQPGRCGGKRRAAMLAPAGRGRTWQSASRSASGV